MLKPGLCGPAFFVKVWNKLLLTTDLIRGNNLSEKMAWRGTAIRLQEDQSDGVGGAFF